MKKLLVLFFTLSFFVSFGQLQLPYPYKNTHFPAGPPDYYLHDKTTDLPWASTSAILAAVTVNERYVGQLFQVGDPWVYYTFANVTDKNTGTLTPYASGGGVGALLAANNLSDLVNAATARTNLGITLPSGAIVGTSDTQTLTNKTLTSPTLTTPALGTPSQLILTNATGLNLNTGVTGILPVSAGGTGTTTPALVAGTNVTITGTWPNQTINSTGGGGGGSYTASSPITLTGSAFGINDAVANGTGKGAASFETNDFNSSAGNISIDYTNAQKATTSLPGLLTAADFTAFNNKGGYTWIETFDDDPTLSGGQTSGLNNTFTLSHTPSSLNNVSVNGVLLDQNQYSLSGATLTLLDRNLRTLNTSSITRSGTTATAVTQYGYSEMVVGSVITVSGASNSALNGTFFVTSVSGGTFTYTTTTSGTISAVTNASISFYAPPSKKSSVKVEYLYSSAQSAPTRYATGNINNVVFYGNSLFYGVGSEHNVSDVATQLKAMLPSVPFRVVNLGSPGITTSALDTYINQVLAPQLSTSYNKNIIIVSEIVNDHAIHPGNSDATLFATYKTLCQNIKALNAGYIVVATTILNTSGYISEGSRVAINNMIIADPSFYDYLINTTANTAIGVAGANTNTTYYNSDGLHLYPEGYYEWAKAMYPTIMTAAGVTAQDISTLPVLTSNNYVLREGGNYNLATATSANLGTARNIPLNFKTFGATRGSIAANGAWTFNPSVYARYAKAVRITPVVGSSDITDTLRTLYIGGTQSTANTKFNQVEVHNSTGVQILAVGNSALATGVGTGLSDIDASASQIRTGNLVITQDVNSPSAPTSGMLNFKSGFDATGNAYFMGINTSLGLLQYNAPFGHYFTIGNNAVFGVGTSNNIVAPYANAFSIEGSSDIPITTKTGLVFRAPGGTGNDVIITRNAGGYGLIYHTGSLGFGFHRWTVGDDSYMNLDNTGKVSIGLNVTTAKSTLHVTGSFGAGYVAKTANYTLTVDDHLVNCTANSFTITLPTAVGIAGREYIVKNTGTATVITIATTSSQTVDGSAPGTVTTLTPYRVVSDGANWITF
jgi:lysophospholipase L1-like esterase